MQVKMENLKLSPNPNPSTESDQLPEADSLPDGFVESSSVEEVEEAVTDYKEEKLLEPESSPQVVIEDGTSNSSKLAENVGDQTKSTAVSNAEAPPCEGSAQEKSNTFVF